uniref:Uncharacterized protein AlNc14C83G5359 n=1 Tax=Albugo laibachii Nc14 TaxID=890382 RepID=F0WFH3_9STRA|nr:conserved hypothetical protein [Albugo laibachii Nc14]|eukprot:CCA19955.1 conserved hypothetical protein [Albugo laibachii Nc14]
MIRKACKRICAVRNANSTALETSRKSQMHPSYISARHIHMTRQQDSVLLLGGLGIAASAMGIKYVIKAYEAYKLRPKSPSLSWNYKSFYEGPFEERMTRREAALILGVRENASPKRIQNAHRQLLILNHPDTGGSTFIASKINEAKQLLLSGTK